MTMNLSTKLGSLCATGAFVLVSLTVYLGSLDLGVLLGGFVQSVQFMLDSFMGGVPVPPQASVASVSMANPLKVLQLGGMGAVAGWFLGSVLGGVLASPKGPSTFGKASAKVALNDFGGAAGLDGLDAVVETKVLEAEGATVSAEVGDDALLSVMPEPVLDPDPTPEAL